MGNDILIRNGHYDIIGDLWVGPGAGITGPSRFIDVAALPNGTYVCFDRNRGRLFKYDTQGNLLYVFGGVGNREGTFMFPSAVSNMGYALYALDAQTTAITRFDLTEYGYLINLAITQYQLGLYDESAETWNRVLTFNGNYGIAYIGMARSLLRQGYYQEAMRYFKLQYDSEGYGRAFGFYRREWMETYFWIFALIIGGLVVVPPVIRLVLRVRKEVRES
jgi:tetratricopeptide (TPR) repeat protein